MKFYEFKEILSCDYKRLTVVPGGVIQRFFLSPQFNLILWFRFLSYIKTKGFIGKILYPILYWRYRWKCAKVGIDLRIGTRIGKGLCFSHYGGVAINAASVIGDNCLILQGVTIGEVRKDGKSLVPQIGNNVVIFAGAKIIGDVKIGDNIVIGANAVVTHDVCDNAVVAGIPAKVISMKGKEYSSQYLYGN